MERLNIYFIHSNKFNYEELIYKKILNSSLCITQNIILPYSNNNKNKYAKDLINKADIIIVDLYTPSFGLTLELKWLSKTKDKKILYLSQDNIIPKQYKKIINNITIHNQTNTYINIIENFIKEELDRRSKINGNIYTLGNIT